MNPSLTNATIGSNILTVSCWNPKNAAPNDIFDYIDIASIDRESKSIVSTTSLRAEDAPSRARQIVKGGDILVSTVRPNLNAVTVVPDHLGEPIASTGFCVLRCDPKRMNSRYLFHWVRTSSFIGSMVRQATGASYPAVTDRIIKESRLPLPPLHKQARIADILDKADAICQARRRTICNAYDLKRVLLLEFTGDAATAHVRPELDDTGLHLPKGFRWRRLDEICVAICDIDHNMPKAVAKGVPLISPKDMPDDGELSFDDVKYISHDDFTRLSRKIKPQRDDIIYSRIGARLGKARLVRVDGDFLASYSCCTIRVNKEVIHPEYLTHYLDSIITRRQANLDTQSIAVPDLGLAKIKAFLVPVPSLEKQQTFVNQVKLLDAQISKMKLALSASGDLFNSLVQRAFRGEL